MSAKAFDVFASERHLERRSIMDTVWFTGYTAEEARKSLVEHDGYPPGIIVKCGRDIARPK